MPRTYRNSTPLPYTDHTIILNPSTITQNQHLRLIIASHVLLSNQNHNDTRWAPLHALAIGTTIIRLILATI